MNCVSPPALSEQQLLEYLDGEADEQTVQHLERCEYCRKKADSLRQFQGSLTARLYRITCPSPLELGEYYLHVLPARQVLLIAQHLHECPHCQRELAQLKTYLGDLSPSSGQSPIQNMRTMIARLVSGSEVSAAAMALRGEGKGPITLEAEGIVITLDVQPAANGQLSILGQVAADDQDQWTGATVNLQQAGAPPLTASVDDLGAFRFEAIHPGASRFMITATNGFIVETPEIELSG
jgi:hypothetical protein